MSTETVVVMPLYIYPCNQRSWKPLYDAITTHPDVDFLVIVNPNSGPGGDALPGRDYLREVPKLNSFPNVRTVGYLAIQYCRRPLSESFRDVELYAGWGREQAEQRLYVEGIYIDETPNHVSDHTSEYLDGLSHFIKGVDGLVGPRLIIHNPGTPPEGDLVRFGSPDVVCVCEEPYALYRGASVQKRLDDFAIGRERSMFQISGVPRSDLTRAVADLCSRGRYVFATALTRDPYESFGPRWADFVAAVKSQYVE